MIHLLHFAHNHNRLCFVFENNMNQWTLCRTPFSFIFPLSLFCSYSFSSQLLLPPGKTFSDTLEAGLSSELIPSSTGLLQRHEEIGGTGRRVHVSLVLFEVRNVLQQHRGILALKPSFGTACQVLPRGGGGRRRRRRAWLKTLRSPWNCW